MKKAIFTAIVAIAISASSVFAQQAPVNQVPDLLSSDWQPTRQQRGQVAAGLDLVVTTYDNSTQGKRAILFSLVYTANNMVEDLYMYFGNSSDPHPWMALRVDDKWYVSKVQNHASLVDSAIEDSNGKVVGVRFVLDSTDGTKTRDVMYP